MRILKSLALGAAVAALAIGAAQAQERVIKMGSEGAYPPFNVIGADGKLQGFDIDIGNALCEQMKAKCEWVTQDWDGAIPALQAGKYDAFISSMSITPERLQQIDFSRKYYNTPPAVAALKEAGITGTTKEDLAGKSIGVQGSTIHFNYAEKTFTDSTIKAYPTADEMQADLANGRIDALNDDSVATKQFLNSEQGKECCVLVGTYPPIEEIHGPGAGIAVKKGNTALADEFSAAIDAIRANGKYKEINDKYFDFDAYGAQ